MNEKINYNAREQRHEKIGIKSQNIKLYEQSSFFTKVFVFAIFITLINFGSSQFYTYQKNDHPFTPKFTIEKKVFILEEDGFVLKRETQTEKRNISGQSGIIEHIVKQGDTISQIAYDYQVKTATILSANPQISPWQTLKIGTKLKILPVDGIYITLDQDTKLEALAKKYNIKIEDIASQNSLGSGTVIVKKGKSIILPGAKQIIDYSQPSKGYIGKKPPKSASQYKYTGEITGNLIKPADGGITQYYHRGHYAVDIANRNKGPIYSAANGVVVKVAYGWNGGYGNMIIIDHGKGMQTLYAHNEKLYVKEGETVKQGQTIAWMGRTGRVRGATGIHLHFEVIINGIKRNPLAYF